MKVSKIYSITAGLALALSMVVAIPAFAQTNTPNYQPNMGQGDGHDRMGGQAGRGMYGTSGVPGMMRQGVFGTVTTVNGDIITMSGRQGFGSTTTAVTYTVDATNATVRKNNATSTVSSIAVGDMIAVQGTVTGTNVTAKSISDGITNRMMGNRPIGSRTGATSTPVMGNGQPVVAGTISAVNGTSLTMTTTSKITYSIDASSAKVLRGQSTLALSSLAVGDKVLVQGTVNGTSVSATTIFDQSAPVVATAEQSKGMSYGLFGGIGQFFMHLFGF